MIYKIIKNNWSYVSSGRILSRTRRPCRQREPRIVQPTGRKTAMFSEISTRVGLCYFAAVLILGGTMTLVA